MTCESFQPHVVEEPVQDVKPVYNAQADDAHTPFDDELELWIIASST